MESPKDTCVVAAALVGITEGIITDLDALAAALITNGISREHVGSTIRAIRDYAALHKLPGVAVATASSTPTGKSWWKRLFD